MKHPTALTDQLADGLERSFRYEVELLNKLGNVAERNERAVKQLESLDLKDNLCSNHPDSVDYDSDLLHLVGEKCACDNCFYGRHEIAMAIIECINTLTGETQ